LTLEKDHEAMEIKDNHSLQSEGTNVKGDFKPLSWNMVRLQYK
jgi:alpha-N-arabinofuranosidase